MIIKKRRQGSSTRVTPRSWLRARFWSLVAKCPAESRSGARISPENTIRRPVLRKTLFANYGAARERAAAALGPGPESGSVSAHRRCGRALAQSNGLNKLFPLNTMAQSMWLPTIRGQVAINRKIASSAVKFTSHCHPCYLSSRYRGSRYSTSCYSGFTYKLPQDPT